MLRYVQENHTARRQLKITFSQTLVILQTALFDFSPKLCLFLDRRNPPRVYGKRISSGIANFFILKYPIPANSAVVGISMLPQPFEWGIFGCDDQRYAQPISNDMSNNRI